MPGTGPAPNPQSRKQSGSQAHTWTDLPSEGYQGPVPVWPLSVNDDSGDRELEVWRTIWRTPQAAAWIRLGWVHDVAIYVRFMVVAESGNIKAATESRQWSDRLGLNPTAMLKNRWRIKADDLDDKRTEKSTPARKARRLKVVDDAVAGS
jgi:hypothetical protein